MADEEQPTTHPSALQTDLTRQLMEVFEGAAESRRSYYEQHPDKRPTIDEADDVIAGYANQNALIAGGLSLVPGPTGMVAIVPEMLLVMGNQVKMIYDLGVAYGKESSMCRELILGITLSTSGTGTLGLLTIQGGRVLVTRRGLRVSQRLAILLAGRVSRLMLKSAVARWVPIVGAFAISVWTRYSTAAIGYAAREILSKEIVLSDEDAVPLEERALEDPQAFEALRVEVMVQKIHALANLVRVDGRIEEQELAYLGTLLDNSDLDPALVEQLRQSFGIPGQRPVDFTPFEKDPDERLALLMDLVALANRRGTPHPAEQLYLQQIGLRVGFSREELALITG